MKPPTSALPLPGASSLADGSRWAELIRRGLLATLVLALAAAFVAGSRADLGVAPPPGVPRSAGVVVLDLSGSVQHDGPAIHKILGALERRLGADARIGLVVFSDSAGITLPATAPRSALRHVVAYFPRHNGRSAAENRTGYYNDLVPQTPWDGTFIGGTLISSGLIAGEQALARAHVRHGTLYLVSDLADDGDDSTLMTKIVARLRRKDVTLDVLRIPGGRPSEFFSTLDPDVVHFLKPRELGRLQTSPAAHVVHRARSNGSMRLPLLVGGIAVLLAVYELLFPRLRFRQEEVA